jgi:hypothetical protein
MLRRTNIHRVRCPFMIDLLRVDCITQAINLRIATLTELARFLHHDLSALTKLLARH